MNFKTWLLKLLLVRRMVDRSWEPGGLRRREWGRCTCPLYHLARVHKQPAGTGPGAFGSLLE